MKTHLPRNWREVELGEIFVFEKKSTIKAGEGNEYGKYKFFTSSDIQSKFIDKAIFDGEYLIFSTGGQAGIHYCNEKFSTTTDCFVVKVNEKINTKYVNYFLRANIHLLEAGFKGIALKHISKEYIKKLRVIYPEKKSIQKKIVLILDKAEKVKELRKESDELTKEYVQSVFLEMFGDPVRNERKWHVKKIDDMSELIQIGPFGTQLHVKDYIKGGIPLINPTHIKDGKIISDPNFSISYEKFSELVNYHLKKGDLIMGRRGEMGRCAVVTKQEDGWLCGTGSLFIRPKKETNSTFLLYAFFQNSTKKLLDEKSQGVTMKNLNLTIVKNLELIFPPDEIQKKFSKFIEFIEKLKKMQILSKYATGNLFNSLIQEAFRGKLVC